MKNKGFTLIELIVVIILISILAVSVAPRFEGSNGYQAHAYRTQLISALRLTQQRAMQQTDNIFCHQIVFEGANNVTRYGIPDRRDCSIVVFPENWLPDATGNSIDPEVKFSVVSNNTVSAFPAQVGFDWMGRPTANCLGGCQINVQSTVETLTITIEDEGYIR